MNATNSTTCKPNATFRFFLWTTAAYLEKIQNDYKALCHVDLPIDLRKGIANVNNAVTSLPFTLNSSTKAFLIKLTAQKEASR